MGLLLNNEIPTVSYTSFGTNFNPFLPDGFSLPFQLDESNIDFRTVGWYFHFYSFFKHTYESKKMST